MLVLLLVAQTAGNLYLPNLNGDIINNGVVAGNLQYIIRTGEWMLALTLVIGLFSVGGIYLASRVAMGAGADMRSAVFARVQTFSTRDMNVFGTASLITRNTNDVQQIQIFLQMALTMMVVAPIMGLGGIAMALHEGAKLSTLLLVALPVMGAFLSVVMLKVIPKFRSMQVKIDRLNEVLREQITGVRVIRAFVRSDFEAQRFSDANQDLTNTALSVNRTFAMMLPVMMVILNLSSVAVVWFGGRLVSEGRDADRQPDGVLDLHHADSLVGHDGGDGRDLGAPRRGQRRAGQPSVSDLARNHQSDHTCDGRSAQWRGSFRTRVIRLPRQRATDSRGSRLHVGRELHQRHHRRNGQRQDHLVESHPALLRGHHGSRQWSMGWMSETKISKIFGRHLGIVPQSAYLFSGTVASNLRFGRDDATDEELWHALEIAQATDFVRAMPGGLDAPIDQGGTNVSGGQRQRLCIARALVKRADAYLFDDCFSALDATTDALLRQALKTGVAGASVVIVAQRVSTIMDADQIIVLDDGRVVGVGTAPANCWARAPPTTKLSSPNSARRRRR